MPPLENLRSENLKSKHSAALSFGRVKGLKSTLTCQLSFDMSDSVEAGPPTKRVKTSKPRKGLYKTRFDNEYFILRRQNTLRDMSVHLGTST